MSRFAACLAVICQLVLQTGQTTSSVFHQDTVLPSSPKDPYYRAFQAVPSFQVTANKLMHNFLHIHPGDLLRHKRAAILEDVVIVMDGSESIPICNFNNVKKGLRHMMLLAKYNRVYDTKYAAVTFGSSATVNFKFLPFASAAKRIMRIPYPDGATNTQAGLEEARKLFVNPSSGHRLFARKILFLVTDGQSNVQRHLTILKANALKSSGVEIFVVAIGPFVNGIDEMMKVASFPPRNFLFRVKNLKGFWNIIKLITKGVAPGKYKIMNGRYDPTCNNKYYMYQWSKVAQ